LTALTIVTSFRQQKDGSSMEIPKLQLALDTFDLPSALRPLQKASPYLDIIEVGTILCLAEGMSAVRTIRSLFPQKIVLADVRIAEAGGLISKMAFESGADWVSVVSGATLNTMEAVANEAQKHGGDVQIELFDGWTMESARQWLSLGIRQLITHRSRDLYQRNSFICRRACLHIQCGQRNRQGRTPRYRSKVLPRCHRGQFREMTS
jgi:3-keto-L-gulonate-6-phosphate decarboxylase